MISLSTKTHKQKKQKRHKSCFQLVICLKYMSSPTNQNAKKFHEVNIPIRIIESATRTE